MMIFAGPEFSNHVCVCVMVLLYKVDNRGLGQKQYPQRMPPKQNEK